MSKTTKSSQRRSGRLPRELPIQVSGIDAMGRDFATSAHTLVLSRYGAEILLNTELVPDQEISICLLGNVQDWDARIVGLFSKRLEGYAYGVEFLFQDGNFWGISFPPAAGSTESPKAAMKMVEAGAEKTFQPLEQDIDFDTILKKVRKAAPLKNYAIRLKCPHLEAHGGLRGETGGGDDQWLILQDRHENLQQVLEEAWTFTCPIHGAQREYPLEAKEADAGFQIRLAGDHSRGGGEPGGAKQKAKCAPKPRREGRTPEVLRVWVRGMDLNGNTFRQSAQSLDVSRNGARLDGLGLLTLPGTTIEVRRHWRKALFRVVWTGRRGTAQASQIGIVCLEPGKNLWNIPENN
ncbi:MAG: hypothetical protein HY316_00610 [Acidobacteria bacterium]|nr:hypothetical protein [Acidobacteriota bacterium]